LRDFSFKLKAIFAANRRWAMARGEESLRLEPKRRHTRRAGQRALIPPPPATQVPVGMVVFGLLAAAALIWIAIRSRRPQSDD